MKNTPLIPALLLLIGAALSAQGIELKTDRSMAYKSVGGVELKLDVFEPAGLKSSDHRPAIVFFFGGGWSGGSTKQFYQQARAMAEEGMVAFSADYRVKGRNKTTPFECVKDGKSAIRWVRQHAAEFGIDPSRIVAAGGSAGGHVAACTGVIEGHEEDGEDANIRSVPNAMILFNPVLDTTEKGYGAKNFKPEQQTEISPCHHVRKGIVPTLVFHGTADKTVPFENAERFTRLMKDEGNECVLVPFEGKDHGFFNGSFFRKSNGDADYEVTMKRSIEFLKAQGFLKQRTTTDRKPEIFFGA
ncbi:MAG: alpha/beta hydrolase [Prosthecobacter sp.]|uniref:alpha/beta hydrolase n=1 Tax=Prosthecobacter sp. TaxID=1965333 RepID=UPI00260E00B0|nr:alpha/beta hydrolase [Prosthecobacter sp.]MCF7790112.1 alpha/beta hydrolase [Prosthecobacter sp.]